MNRVIYRASSQQHEDLIKDLTYKISDGIFVLGNKTAFLVSYLLEQSFSVFSDNFFKNTNNNYSNETKEVTGNDIFINDNIL